MSHPTNNQSDISHSTRFSPTEMTERFSCLSSLKQMRIKILSDIIKSFEIKTKQNSKSSSSPTENIRDIFLQSNVMSTKLNLQEMKDQIDPDTLEKLTQYNTLCDIMTFQSFNCYFNTNPAKFKNNMNFILDTESSIFNQLCKMKHHSNTCMVVESRHKTNKGELHCNDEEDDNNPASKHSRRNSMKHNYSLWKKQRIHKMDKLQSLFCGYINKHYCAVPISMDIVSECIRFSDCYTVDRFMRENIKTLAPEPFRWSHYNINWNKNDAELVQVHNSKVPNEVIENRWNLYPILNSVHSEQNVPNTMTWLYIKYQDIVMIYMYITDENGASYGTRLTEDNIATVVPSLFVDGQINVSLDGFKSAIDPILDEYKAMLFKNNHKKSHSHSVNGLEQTINIHDGLKQTLINFV